MANFYEDLAGEAGSDMESDVSDVNPAEMAKMLQGLDDMDDALFKSSTRENQQMESPGKTSRKTTSAQDLSLKRDKQHVTFGETTKDLPKKGQSNKTKEDDFDWDDPLGDILSSDESVGKAKSSNQQVTLKKGRQETTSNEQSGEKSSVIKDKTQKGKLVKDLFGLEDTIDTNDKHKEKALSKPTIDKKIEEPKSLESYLDKKSPKKPDTTSLNDDLNSKVWSVSDTAMTKKKTNSKASMFQKNADLGESDDLLMGLGLESDKKTASTLFSGKSNVSKSRSIMNDIFTNTEKNIALDESKKNKQETSTEELVSFGNYAPSNPTSRESRRSAVKRESSSIGDPLGLFSPPITPQRNQINVRSDQKPVSHVQSSTPVKKSAETISEEKGDWLGLSASKEVHSLSPDRKRHIEKKPSKSAPADSGVQVHSTSNQTTTNSLPEWLGGSGGNAKQKESAGRTSGTTVPLDPHANIQNEQPKISPVESGSLPTAQGLSLQMQSQMEQEATYALQMQEQQLRTALHMRKHEVQLASVHERQRTLLLHQEQQMQQLLSQQAQRQKQLEQQLQLQQQRIADYMQALMSQPPTTILSHTSHEIDTLMQTSIAKEKISTNEENNGKAVENNEQPELTDKDDKVQLMELQVSLQQCELEKKSLESTLENLQVKHKEELKLMEECYKRQVSIVEEAMEKHNVRMRAENERIEEEYKERLIKMQDQQAALTESHAQHLASLQKEHIADMQTLKDQHNALLEHLRHIQHSETNAVKEASQNMTILHSAVEQLGRNTDNLSEMHGWLEKQSNAQTELRELALKTKEAEVQAYKDNLARQREAAEEERRKLLSLVEQLELQVSQQRSKAEEERYSLRQETVRLDSRTEAFEREKERVKTEIERERQHVEKARQVLLEEQKTVSLQLKEEKLSIAKERARIQALAQLQGAAVASEEEMMQLKAEAEAALTVAKEATDQVETQKLVIQEQQRHLEKERRRLQDLEHTLTVRARELEALTQTALATRNEGAEALANAVQAEERQKQRAMDLQRQLAEVKEREQRLAEERISLSQERLKIHRIKEQKVCSSCRGSLIKPATSTDQSQFIGSESNKFIDPKKVILKLVAEKERDALLSNSLHSLSAPKQ